MGARLSASLPRWFRPLVGREIVVFSTRPVKATDDFLRLMIFIDVALPLLPEAFLLYRSLMPLGFGLFFREATALRLLSMPQDEVSRLLALALVKLPGQFC